MRPPGSQLALLQPLGGSMVVVTHSWERASCCAGSLDWPNATAGHARNFRHHGSHRGSPAVSAIAAGWPPWKPAGKRASRSSSDAFLTPCAFQIAVHRFSPCKERSVMNAARHWRERDPLIHQGRRASASDGRQGRTPVEREAATGSCNVLERRNSVGKGFPALGWWLTED